MKCTSPMRLLKNIDLNLYPQGIEVACGQCMMCRIARREEWSLRLMHESLYWDSSIFVTLTYDENHLPKNGSLVLNDIQKFFKRLRKNLDNRKIKYFACGDYGGEFDRPHYHMIIFGLDYLKIEDRELIKKSWKLCDWDMLGKQPFGDVKPASIRYVCKYIESKVIGKEAVHAYDEHDIIPTFAIMSKGIGKDYLYENIDKLQKFKYCEELGRKMPIPRYYKKIAIKDDKDLQEYGKIREIDKVESISGHRLTRDEAYMSLMPDEVLAIEDEIKRYNSQSEVNAKAKIKLNERKKC